MSTLKAYGLAHRYGQDDVLVDVDLQLPLGETLALVGPSGCGKTTLLHIMAGLIKPTAGEVHNPYQRVSCVFQQPRLMPWKSVLDNIALGLKAKGQPRDEGRAVARRWALRLGLREADLAKFPHELSGGMQSRVALGRALAISPDLLLLDEPFSALDVGLKLELYNLLRECTADTTMAIMMITHDLMEAVRLADRILLMAARPGRIVQAYTLHTAAEQRDEPWVYAQTGALMQDRVLRFSFGLPAADVQVPV